MEKVNQILKDLKNKNYKPVYFFQGEESFFIDLLVDYMEEFIIEESAKAFDQLILYGKDVSMLDVISAAKKFPLISDKQLIIVKEAANIKDTEHLIGYIKFQKHYGYSLDGISHFLLNECKKSDKDKK